jgi:plasmid maintenance system antidote protein VapI
MFSMIVRLADAFGWDVPTWERLQQRAPAMLEGGYVMQAIGER